MTRDPAVSGLPYSFARRHGIVVRPIPEGGVECYCLSKPSLEALLEVQRVAGRTGPPIELDEPAFRQVLQDVYEERASEAATAAERSDADLASLADSAAQIDDLLDSSDNAPVIQLINALLLKAMKQGASDIHLETQERHVRVRFRIDGVLQDILHPKRDLSPLLISRIKVMAGLDIAEKRLPQDGRVTLSLGGHEIDVRVSTVPAQHAERVVLRLLDRGAARHDLTTLGMSARDLAAFERMLARPHGIVLVTGPTGSGKTTTLYAALQRLNDRTRNIMTVEDPIEYAVEGVGQIQVNARTELTFARGLRAILRQDPDVIMVGEIRDAETARIAVQSSMTGHFVLSTLHTNSAIGSVSRLVDMGVERFLLAPMLTGLISQRLVRRLCPNCAEPYAAGPSDRDLMGDSISIGETLFRAGGCTHCRHEGYRGRTALYEVVEADARLERLIHAGAAEADLAAAAQVNSATLLDDGIAKARLGVTSPAEVARVVFSD